MWLALIGADEWGFVDTKAIPKSEDSFDLLPWIGIKTADNKFVPWLASQTDILAEDWSVVP